jgi:hypothetical protein
MGDRGGHIDFEIIELLFFAYRDFISDPDAILDTYGFGRAHHRVVHFVNREPGLTVAALLETLKITKQSLGQGAQTAYRFRLHRTGRRPGGPPPATALPHRARARTGAGAGTATVSPHRQCTWKVSMPNGRTGGHHSSLSGMIDPGAHRPAEDESEINEGRDQ